MVGLSGVLWRRRRCLSIQRRTLYFKSVVMLDHKFLYGSSAFSALLAGKHLDRVQVLRLWWLEGCTGARRAPLPAIC